MYVDSWVEVGFGCCFQLMECDDFALLQWWVVAWEDIVRFEIVLVMTSVVAVELVL